MDNLNLNLYDKKKNIISSNYACRNNDYFSNSFYGGGYHFDMKLKTKSNTNKYLNTSNISNCSTNSNLTNIKIKTERVLRRTNSALNIDSYESSKKNKDYSLFDGNRFNDGQNLNTSKLQLDKLKKEYYTNIQSDRQRSNSKEILNEEENKENEYNNKDYYTSRNTSRYNYNQYIISKKNYYDNKKKISLQYPVNMDKESFQKDSTNCSYIENCSYSSNQYGKSQTRESTIGKRCKETHSTVVNTNEECGGKKMESVEEMHLQFVKMIQSCKREFAAQEEFLCEY